MKSLDLQIIPIITQNAEIVSQKIHSLNDLNLVTLKLLDIMKKRPKESEFLEFYGNHILIRYIQLSQTDNIPNWIKELLEQMETLNILSPLYRSYFLKQESATGTQQAQFYPFNYQRKILDELFQFSKNSLHVIENQGVSLWNLNAELIWADISSVNLMELEGDLQEVNFFDKFISISKSHFKQSFQKKNLDFHHLQDNSHQNHFSYVIYSNKKKSQFLNFLKHRGIKKLKSISQEEKAQENKVMYHRYMKGLNSYFHKVQVIININDLK